MSPSPWVMLVVDEDAGLATQVQALLAHEPVTVLAAGDGARAMALLKVHEVALALVSLQLPERGGFALAQAMRMSARGRHVPIVFTLALDQALPGPERALVDGDAGAIDFVYKPLNPTVLSAKVRLFRDLQRQQRLLAQRMTELERASQLNALMLASLSHDIRTPLASLSLSAELVLRLAESPGLRQAGERIKAAAATLGRQVDHLVNLSQLPTDSLRPEAVTGDVAALAAQRIALAGGPGQGGPAVSLSSDGNTLAEHDPALLAQALDHLLLLAAAHGQGQPVAMHIDGLSRHTLKLRLSMPAVLGNALSLHLFGGGTAIKGLPAMRVGPGLDTAEQIARAHGGSLIGRSREPEGTLFELVLPRAGQ